MSDLISPEYLDQLHKMRAANHRPNWGNGGQKHVEPLLRIIEEYNPKSVLDYGCGHWTILSVLSLKLGTKIPKLGGYDPGIPSRATLPEPADLVFSTDVLEHIEPDKLESVLDHIRTLTLRVAYLNVHTSKATAILPDGRNAHLIQQPREWWQAKFESRFISVEYLGGGPIRPTFKCLV